MLTHTDTNTAEILQDTRVDISVRNFGPISEASIDLRPLTVFVGPSNTGKTYFSTLIYALHGLYAGFSRFPWRPLTLWSFLSTRGETVDADMLKAFEKLNTPNRAFSFSDLPPKMRQRLRKKLETADVFKEGLEHYFDIETVSELIRDIPAAPRSFPAAPTPHRMQVLLKVNAADQALWDVSMAAVDERVDLRGEINEEMVLFPASEHAADEILDVEELFEQLQGPREGVRRYYLPAARSGIMQSHSVIASSLVARSTRAGIERFPEGQTFSGGIADFMQGLIRPERRRSKSSPDIEAIADVLEAEVLSGKIEVSRPTREGYPEFRYQAADMATDIRLSRASSMVSELAAFVLFLRGVVRPKDTLIIEEPESHLHPGAQSAMAVALARLVHAGVRVVVTTHSDWFLEEIGNLLRAGELDALGEQADDSSLFLRKEQIGVWHFEKNAPVKEIPYDRFAGVEPQEYGAIAETLYNRSARLQNQLESATLGSQADDE